MNIDDYLRRIKYGATIDISNDTLIKLHENHCYNVPFENIDIHYKRPFDLAFVNVYEKVINKVVILPLSPTSPNLYSSMYSIVEAAGLWCCLKAFSVNDFKVH